MCNMKALQFQISGRTAHFKRPDVNTYAYFTYSHIHKVALYGILGAIVGLKGYADQGKAVFPEFYEKLKDLEVAIVPISKKAGLFSKKIQTFNNSVGYASKEQGNNLIVKEQWLEDVCWRIYLSLDSKMDNGTLEKLSDYLLQSSSVFTPYLGKNDHPATIDHVKIVDLVHSTDADTLNSLFYYNQVQLDDGSVDYAPSFTLKDEMPIGINEHGMYLYEKIGLTNRIVLHSERPIYQCDEEFISFL